MEMNHFLFPLQQGAALTLILQFNTEVYLVMKGGYEHVMEVGSRRLHDRRVYLSIPMFILSE